MGMQIKTEKLDAVCARFKVLDEKVQDASVIADNKAWAELCRERAELEPIVEKYAEYKKAQSDYKDATEMDVFSCLKYESGVHRVQRVPVTETQGRVHTSTVTVAVLPEAETVDVEILDKDIKIDTYRSSGAGGQHINKTDSAIRITHFPTGIVVTCQDQRSQTKNKERAMQVLATKLYDFYQGQKDEEYASLRKGQVGTGDRSERIRTYNFPQGRVTDHRIGFTLYSIDEFMNGDLDKMVEALRIADQTRRLEGDE